MAGRGRGRGAGRGGMSFSIEALGLGRGDTLPGPIHQPPPLFPPLEYKPVPLLVGEEYDYLLALKQEFRAAMRESPYYLKMAEKKRDIERYSDKYQIGGQDTSNTWEPDWSRLPKELRLKTKRQRKLKAVIKPKLPKKLDKSKTEDITKTLEELEKKEETTGTKEAEEEEEKEEEKDEIEEEFYDDEDLEDDNDYNFNYFDNGDDAIDEDDDMDEGPVY